MSNTGPETVIEHRFSTRTVSGFSEMRGTYSSVQRTLSTAYMEHAPVRCSFFEPGSGGKIFLQFLAVSGGLVSPAERTPDMMDILRSLTDPDTLPPSIQNTLNNGGQVTSKLLTPASVGTYELASASWDDLPKVRLGFMVIESSCERSFVWPGCLPGYFVSTARNT